MYGWGELKSGYYRRLPMAIRALCILGAVLLVACMSDMLAGGSTSTQTGAKINLSGRVVDKNDAGVAGVVVEIKRAGLKDTTDALGRYVLEGSVTVSGINGGSASMEPLDTLLVKQNGQKLLSLPIFKWVDVLPDIKIIQRDVSGKLLSAPASTGRVEAVISGEGIPVGQPVVVPLYHFKLSGSYTGFAYFQATVAVAEYVVYVRVLDTAGRFIGRSPDVPFSTMAGNIPIPDFDAGNALPKADAGPDTTDTVGDIVVLKGKATDDFGGQITRFEWDVGATGFFRPSATGDIAVNLPNDPWVFPAILRVWDDDGNSSTDTVVITSVPVRPAACGGTVMVFYADNQVCRQWWVANSEGIETSFAFEIADTAIVKLEGSPIGLPVGYTGPYPPAAQYLVTIRPAGKRGTTEVRIRVLLADGRVQYYNPWTIRNPKPHPLRPFFVSLHSVWLSDVPTAMPTP
jgi:hypothetical protein